MLSALFDLLLPQRCTVCGAGEQPLCALCLARWEGPAQKCARISGFDVYAARPYDSLAASVIVGAKDHHRRWLLPLLVAGVHASVTPFIHAAPLSKFVLVPVPSRQASLRRRGEDILLRIAQEVAATFRQSGVDVSARSLLEHTRPVDDQSGLTSLERHNNVQNAFALKKSKGMAQELSQRSMVIVDDIITTGASMREALRAGSGLHLLGGACAAATSLR